jgi:hypothetical protein
MNPGGLKWTPGRFQGRMASGKSPNAGGTRPVWSCTSRELFFENLDYRIYGGKL